MTKGNKENQTIRTPVHISILLDRSGSMSSIADDMVGGLNAFLEEQRRGVGSARVTLAQFDSQDPFEVLIAGDDLASVSGLDPHRYLPRDSTPLFDAVGRMIARIDGEILERADAGLPIEDQLVVIITDGFENASTEFSGRMIHDLIEARRGRAWAFVFLGADDATFTESSAIGISRGSTLRWDKTGQRTAEMLAKLSNETSSYRAMERLQRTQKSEAFMEEEQ